MTIKFFELFLLQSELLQLLQSILKIIYYTQFTFDYPCADYPFCGLSVHNHKLLMIDWWWWRWEIHDKSAPVTTAWRVLGLRMEERPPDMEGSCEYIE
jgi:hypothetical protein